MAVAYRYLWECSRFYRRKFEEAGLGPDSVHSVDDLPKIPLTHREEWLEDQEANPPWGTFSPLRDEDWLERGWMFFSTSGTTAKSPRVFRHTTFDRDIWGYLGARGLHSMGIRNGDLAILCFSYGTSVGFWSMHYALHHMGVPLISGGGANTERRAMFIQNYRPTVLMCTPSYVLYMGRKMEALGISPRESSIRLICASGEPGACVPATKKRVEELWGAEIHDHFGCTEVAMPPLGYPCSHLVKRKDKPVDSHLMEDVYIPEALDPQTYQPVPEGQPGVLVVSNLYSEAQPILRYVMGDWIAISTEPCECGRTHARAVGGLRGRNDKLIKIRGLLFFPAAIEDAIRSLPEVGDEFRVELDHVGDMDQVKVTIEPSPQTAEISDRERRAKVVEALKGTLGLRVDLEVVPYGSLPRSKFKSDRLTDRRPKLFNPHGE
ncbi:MAG: CoF synthetase [Planctomycetes bacterium RBG_16_64_12]|nr:MAG: CoF synthetase [Planctomycetes bacterium RBG_16_64_12]